MIPFLSLDISFWNFKKFFLKICLNKIVVCKNLNVSYSFFCDDLFLFTYISKVN